MKSIKQAMCLVVVLGLVAMGCGLKLGLDGNVRFMRTSDAIIHDSVTGLQWLPDLGRKDITWDDAQAYVRGLKAGGFSDWRLPSRVELKSLYDPSIKAEYKIDPMFQLSACCPWTGDLYDSLTVWIFYFNNGHEIQYSRSYGINKRVLAVRSALLKN